MDINTIRAWLGHVSIDTTNVYAEVDLETKAQMASTIRIPANKNLELAVEDLLSPSSGRGFHNARFR